MPDTSSQVFVGLPWTLARRLAALGLLLLCGWSAWTFPLGHLWLGTGLLLYYLALWRWPSAWLVVVPAALPVLDLAYWSGRFFFNAYDLVVLTTVAAGLWRARPRQLQLDRTTLGVALVLLVAQTLITLNGLFPLSSPAPGAWTDYFASTNALRQFKGILWALLLLPMLAIARREAGDYRQWLSAGMLLGLAGAIATILWERMLFTGVFDLRSAYRVSGWFSAMHTGGAAIDAYLSLAAPFAAALFLLWRDLRLRLLGMAIGAGALYALYVTYSRADYLAVLLMALVFAYGLGAHRLAGALRSGGGVWRNAMLIGFLVVVGGILITAIGGRNIQSRFATSQQDLAVRLHHWQNTLHTMDAFAGAHWLGMGKGSFPVTYYWQHETAGEHLALAEQYQEDGKRFVRFSKSDRFGTLFLRQRFAAKPDGDYRLKLLLRTPEGQAERLLVEFCERHILAFRSECQWRGINIPAGTRDWTEFNASVSLHGLGNRQRLGLRRPVDISIMDRGIHQGLDIGSVQLIGPDGQPRLDNADFAKGWDHWFLSYGNHLRWHIKNVFVYWWFEGGLLGTLVMLGLGGVVAVRLARATHAGDRFALIVLAALAGTLMVGLFDSLFDEPRIAQLFYLLAFAGLLAADQRADLRANRIIGNGA